MREERLCGVTKTPIMHWSLITCTWRTLSSQGDGMGIQSEWMRLFTFHMKLSLSFSSISLEPNSTVLLRTKIKIAMFVHVSSRQGPCTLLWFNGLHQIVMWQVWRWDLETTPTKWHGKGIGMSISVTGLYKEIIASIMYVSRI